MPAVIVMLMLAFFVCTTVFAEWVSGYYRSDGTYVSGYNRSSPNSTVTDNYSFKDNYNPYTGKTGTNYYRSSPSSPYYNPYSTPRTKSSWGW